MRRCLFVSFVLFGLTFLLLSIMIIVLFFLFKTVNRIHARTRITVQTALLHGQVMRLMNRFPYSKFMLREARDCPICFEQFTDKCEVVQLKCNDLHIFHYKCMERYLNYEDENLPIAQAKQCPLCRKDIEV